MSFQQLAMYAATVTIPFALAYTILEVDRWHTFNTQHSSQDDGRDDLIWPHSE